MTDLDADQWRLGRNDLGTLSNIYLRENYPFVDIDYKTIGAKEVYEILKENFEPNHLGLNPYLVRLHVVFFQEKEDAIFFQGLLYLY